ncbi:MAG TPA: homoserine kinase [Vicinamibacteria bacterium]|nr:homoserine kinase [Vicinamibacteria bacterium]
MSAPPAASVFAPASIGNVGPGFDVLGLAVEGPGDEVRLELVDGPSSVEEVTGLDAELIPREPESNVVTVAAAAMLRALGDGRGAKVWLRKGIPQSGGLGGSAASSVAGAWAAALAAGREPRSVEVMAAALTAEATVAGRHLDNISACVLGGLTLVRSTDPIDVVRVPLARPLWVALVTPGVRLETRTARSVLPSTLDRATWVQQMANTAALLHGLASGDLGLVSRALVDGFAEPRRAGLIPRFAEVKRAALDAGALGSSISGAGPTIFALAEDEASGTAILAAMRSALADVPGRAELAAVATRGARPT